MKEVLLHVVPVILADHYPAIAAIFPHGNFLAFASARCSATSATAYGTAMVISFPHYDQAISSFPNVVFSAALSDFPIFNLGPINALSISVHRAACRPPSRD